MLLTWRRDPSNTEPSCLNLAGLLMRNAANLAAMRLLWNWKKSWDLLSEWVPVRVCQALLLLVQVCALCELKGGSHGASGQSAKVPMSLCHNCGKGVTQNARLGSDHREGCGFLRCFTVQKATSNLKITHIKSCYDHTSRCCGPHPRPPPPALMKRNLCEIAFHIRHLDWREVRTLQSSWR